MPLKLQFDPNQPHQHDAVEAIARLFNGLPRDILVTLDSALSDEAKIRLADQRNLKVI